MLASLCCKVLLLFLGILSLIISVLTFILTYVKQTSTLFEKIKKYFCLFFGNQILINLNFSPVANHYQTKVVMFVERFANRLKRERKRKENP